MHTSSFSETLMSLNISSIESEHLLINSVLGELLDSTVLFRKYHWISLFIDYGTEDWVVVSYEEGL